MSLILREVRDRGTANVTSTGRVSRAKTNSYARSVALRVGTLGYSNAISAGDAVRQELVDRAEAAAMHGPVRTLVKNGKPLCPEGAMLLKRSRGAI